MPVPLFRCRAVFNQIKKKFDFFFKIHYKKIYIIENDHGGYMMKKLTILTAVFMLLLSSVLFAEKAAFVGAQKCKICHTGQKNHNVYEKWEKAPHARAFETLKAKGEEKNPKCLPCHTTGFNEGGYKPGAPNASNFEGVQCESCHGPGSLYKDSKHMKDLFTAVGDGLMIPMESLCTKCHNKNCPSFKGFDYETAAKRITHIYKTSS